MNLIDMRRMPAEIRRKFKSDFRVVAEYMACKTDSKAVREYVRNDSTVLSHPGAVLDLFGALTGKKDYKAIRKTIEENVSHDRIAQKLQKHFSLNEQEAKEYISKDLAM